MLIHEQLDVSNRYPALPPLPVLKSGSERTKMTKCVHCGGIIMETIKFKVEENVPLPRSGRPSKLGTIKEILRGLQLNQSFEIPEFDDSMTQALANVLIRVGHELGVKFARRKTESGIRIWRIK